MTDTPDGGTAIQRDLSRLEEWENRNLLKCEKGKCKVLHLGRNNTIHTDRLGADQLESRLAEVLVANKVNMSAMRCHDKEGQRPLRFH